MRVQRDIAYIELHSCHRMTSVLSSDDISIYAVDSYPFGTSYVEWSIRWWKWLLGIPKEVSPSSDSTGQYAQLKQSDPNVFFLCQTFTRHDDNPTRHVIVPFGKAIFMPIINWISVFPDDGRSDDDLLAMAKRKIDAVENLELSINYQKLKVDLNKYRVTSTAFEVYLPKNNLLNAEEGYSRCVSDGYWVLFLPFKQKLLISSYGSCSLGITKIAISYDINFQE